MLRVAAVFALILLMAGLFVGGAQPQAVGLFPVPWDKVVHLVFFMGVAGLIGIAFGGFRMSARALWAVASVGGVAIGCADEFHQAFLPGRRAGIDDLLFDVLGATLGAWLVMRIRSHIQVR